MIVVRVNNLSIMYIGKREKLMCGAGGIQIDGSGMVTPMPPQASKVVNSLDKHI